MLCVGMPSATLRVVFSSQEPRPMGRTRYQFGEAPFPHFPTCTVIGWLPVLTRTETLQIVLDSWQFLQEQERMVLFGYVVLENHIHFIGCRHNRLVIQRFGDDAERRKRHSHAERA